MTRRLFPLLILCLVVVLPVFAQQPTTVPVFPLKPGAIEGNINNAAPVVRYSFDASADDSVSISMETTSGDLDPFLFLYAPDGTLVERNDDRESGNRNALIALTLPQQGTYVIEATRFEQASVLTSGTFRLTLALSGAQATG
ncbi:MAG: PPC domain-containing protein, partial [Anaerolineae bacterium]|nr:PPC domain-containing protein [Anaerolineae bacterium]